MHPEAYEWVQRQLAALPDRHVVVEIGSRNVNGSVRGLLRAAAVYIGVDIAPGPDVDLVMDAAADYAAFTIRDMVWRQGAQAIDTVICMEVLEHAPLADRIVATAFDLLASGGVFLMTCATNPRAPHSAIDGRLLMPHEYSSEPPARTFADVSYADLRNVGKEFYRNVGRFEAGMWIVNAGGRVERSDCHERGDLYVKAIKP